MNPPPVLSRLAAKFAAGRFLTISFTIHLGLVALLGSVILFKVAQKPEAFVAAVGTSDSFLEEAVAPADPVAETPQEFEEPTLAAAETTPSSMTSLTVLSTLAESSSNWKTPATPMETMSAGNSLSSAKPVATSSVTSSSSKSQTQSSSMATSFFGTPAKSGGMEGTFYDLKQTADGKPRGESMEEMGKLMAKFLENVIRTNWSPATFDKFFQGKSRLRAENIFIPETRSLEATKAFGLNQVEPTWWVILYQGSFVVPETDQYRFVGRGDNVLFVSVGGKTVFDGDLFTNPPDSPFSRLKQERIESMVFGTSGGKFGGYPANAGPWQTWRKGEVLPIKVLIGEKSGGNTFAFLLVQQKSKTYATASQGYPILPPFRMSSAPVIRKGPGNVPEIANDGPIFEAR